MNPYKNLVNREYYFDTWAWLLIYPEASVKECFEFVNEQETNKYYVLEFLKNFCDKYFVARDTKKWGFTKKDTFKFELVDTNKLWDQISQTHFRWFFSDEKWDKSPNAPFSSIMHTLWKQTWQDPYQLIEKWTYAQFNEFLEGYVWNMKEQYEEWKKENDSWRLAHKDTEFLDKQMDSIDDFFDNIDNKIKEWKVKVTSTNKVKSK